MNDLDALEKHYTVEDTVEKIVMSLTAPWKSKITLITENPKFVILTLDQLRENLIAYKSTFLKEEMEAKKKHLEVALKADEKINLKEGKSQETQPNHKEMALITKTMYNYKKRCQNKRERRESPSRYESSKDVIIYYECQKPCHIKTYCSLLKEEKQKESYGSKHYLE